jgi:hypothetical protein
MTVVQGNPARPFATCGVTLVQGATLKEFHRSLRPLAQDKRSGRSSKAVNEFDTWLSRK